MKFLFFIVFCSFIYASNEKCENYFKKIEQENNIPENVLKAIAYTESGQKIAPNKMVAWPWTINVKGKGYIFETKQKAVVAARFMLQLGYNNFDIGCMQVNLKHHPKAFKSIEEGFTPEKNVAYAAEFLTKLKAENRSWEKAIAHYHNVQEKFNQPYQKRVLLYKNQIQQNFFEEIEERFSTSYLKKAFTESDLTFFSNTKQSLSSQNLIDNTAPKTVVQPVIHTFGVTQPSNKITSTQTNRFGVSQTNYTQTDKRYTLPRGLSVSYTPQTFSKHTVNTMQVRTIRYVNGEIKKQNVIQTEIKTTQPNP